MPPRNMQPELTLLAKMKQGDEAAFVALYRQHKDAVYRFSLLVTGSHHVASDVTQETFMFFLSRPGQYDPTRGTIAAWLCGVARNMARKDSRNREDATDPEELEGEGFAAHLLADNVTPLDRILKDETAELVRRAVAAIAPHYRDVLILCELSELSYAEAAQVCGIDIGTVRSRLSRARAQLADRLGRLGVLTTSAPAKEAVQ